MADVNINKFRASVVRDGSKPASPGFIVSEGQDPVDPAGNGQNHLPVTIATAATGLSITDSQVLGGAGNVGQYIRGDGSLADFPATTGGGSSVSYYLNGSVSQGTIGGVAYKELNKTPIFGAGTDITISADGYIASFITDAGDPNKLLIPAGNWNLETYFSASSSGGTPSFYVELYKYNGTTFTLIASSSSAPELIAFGTNLNPYFSTLAVPETVLALTDRLALRYYVTHSGRTITLHTENNHLCQVITTFTTGLTALNGLTSQVQYLTVGTSGTDFAISSASDTHTFNLPTASATNRGALSSADWTTFNNKTSNLGTVTSVGLSSATSGVTIGSTPVTTSGTITLAIATASGSQNGLLSSTDWTTFNNKAPSVAGGYLPLSGGTLTGALNGTSAAFSSFGRFGGWNIATNFGVNTGANTSIYMNEVDSATVELSAVNNTNTAVKILKLQSPGGATQIGGALAVTGAATFTGGLTVNNPSNSSPLELNNTVVSNYVFLNSPVGLEAMTRYYNPTAGNWYTGIRAVAGIDTTASYHIFSSTLNSDVFALNTNGSAKFFLGSGEMRLTRSGTAEYLKLNTYYLLTDGNDQLLGSVTGATSIYAGNGVSPRLTITSGGNVGIGITPNSWDNSFKVLQVGTASISQNNNVTAYVGSNWVSESGGDKYIATGHSAIYAQNTGNHIWYNAPSGTVGAAITFTEQMRITSDTNAFMRMASGSGGIQFNGDTAAANALDDYEEGNWTPSVGGNATYNAANKGKYTKIGNIVTCQFRLHITLIGTGSIFQLSGFPFSSANISDAQSGHCSYYQDLAVNTIYLSFYIENNATTAQFVGKSTSGATTDNAITLFGNGTIIYGQITYRTS